MSGLAITTLLICNLEIDTTTIHVYQSYIIIFYELYLTSIMYFAIQILHGAATFIFNVAEHMIYMTQNIMLIVDRSIFCCTWSSSYHIETTIEDCTTIIQVVEVKTWTMPFKNTFVSFNIIII